MTFASSRFCPASARENPGFPSQRGLFPAFQSLRRLFPGFSSLRGLFLAGLWLFLLAGAALAEGAGEDTGPPQDYIVARAFWTDLSSRATLAGAREQVYTPYRGILSQGYGSGIVWVRLTVAASEKPLVLLVTPSWLDDITLHDPEGSGESVTLGDHHPVTGNALYGPGYSFKLPARPVPRDVWLRLQSTSVHILNAQILAQEPAERTAVRQLAWACVYGAILALSFWVLLAVGWGRRDPLLRAFLVRHAAYTYYGVAYLGLPTVLFAEWLPPVFFDKAFSISAIVAPIAALFFDVRFLAAYRANKYLLALLKGLGVLWGCALLLLLAGHERFALQLNVAVVILALVTMTAAAFTAKSEYQAEMVMPKRMVVAYYLVIFSSLFIGVANLVGWFAAPGYVLYALILHGMVSVLMMAGILIVRAQRLASRSQQMDWELQKAQRDVEAEQRRHQEQSQFLHMLMHELKTPLTVISLAMSSPSNREKNFGLASDAVRDIKAIIDRCVQADQFGELAPDEHRESFDVSEEIRQLATGTALPAARLQLETAAALPALNTDRRLFRVVVGNLLQNAGRYSDPVTPVTIRVEPSEHAGLHGIGIRVGNTPGVAGWPDAERLFSKYYRACGAQRDSGSGLGLYLSRQLANSLGGFLNYAPSAHQVEFLLWIPSHPA